MIRYDVKLIKKEKQCSFGEILRDMTLLFKVYDVVSGDDVTEDKKSEFLRGLIDDLENNINGVISSKPSEWGYSFFHSTDIEKLKRLESSKRNKKGFYFEITETENNVRVENMGKLD